MHSYKAAALTVLTSLVALTAGMAHAGEAVEFPRKSVRVIVPSAPGGGTDLIARMTTQRASELWGQPVVVENIAGGGTTIGMNTVARSAPDGYTMLLTTTNFAFVPALYAKLPYDAKNDFAPVVMLATQSSMLAVHPSLPVRNVKDLIALAKAHPGEVRYGSGGNGTVGHLVAELFRSMAGVRLLHIPYKGTGQNSAAIMSGEIQMLIANIASLVQPMKAGRVRGIAVTSLTRSKVVPELPTVSDSGVPGYEYSGWYGLWAPAKTPKPVIARINQDFNTALTNPQMRERFAEVGIEAQGGTDEKFTAYVHSELVKWAKVARDADIKAD